MVGRARELPDGERTVLVSVLNAEQLPRSLREFFDEDAFLSPHGLRAVSKCNQDRPYTLDGIPGAWIDYEPGERRRLPDEGGRRPCTGVPRRCRPGAAEFSDAML